MHTKYRLPGNHCSINTAGGAAADICCSVHYVPTTSWPDGLQWTYHQPITS